MRVGDATRKTFDMISRVDAISRCSPSESTVTASTPYARRHLGMMKTIKDRRHTLAAGLDASRRTSS